MILVFSPPSCSFAALFIKNMGYEFISLSRILAHVFRAIQGLDLVELLPEVRLLCPIYKLSALCFTVQSCLIRPCYDNIIYSMFLLTFLTVCHLALNTVQLFFSSAINVYLVA